MSAIGQKCSILIYLFLSNCFKVFQLSVTNSSLVAGGKVGSLACFGVAMECAASKCANARWPLLCPRGMVHNVYLCDVVGLRLVYCPTTPNVA
jgi:hypothetical protein